MTRERTRARTAGGSISRRAALGLVLGGVGALGFQQTGAYSSTIGERGFEATTADDPNGLVGMVGNEDPAVTPTVTNNSSYTMDVTLQSANVVFDVNGNDTFDEPVSFTLPPGEPRAFNVAGDDGNVTITAQLSENDNSAGSVELVRSFVTPAVAAIEKVEASVRDAFGNGRYQFALTNTSDEPITLNGFGVEWTDPDSDRISVQGNQPTLANDADNTDLITETISVGGGVVDVVSGNEIQLDPSMEVDFEFRRFRDVNGDGVFVKDVDLAVRADDGSSAVIELRSED
ncbi:MAG: hypothetical protein ACQET5_13430 [Halobacteriota archaeon]|uniref:hypothetical protein n=1 Tax=Natronomonas sp. TaxID=2184060 RepID=UPI0039764A89